MKNERVCVYLRCSTTDQSTDLQRNDLMAYCRSRGWNNVTVYEDLASGRTDEKRPQFKQMMDDVFCRKFDVVLCWKLDRIFRSIKGMVMTIEKLNDCGVCFVSYKDQIDLTTAAGRLMVHIISAFAEFEADIIRERVIAGMRAAAERGKKPGRARGDYDTDMMLKMRMDGKTVREIAAACGLKKSQTHNILKELTGRAG